MVTDLGQITDINTYHKIVTTNKGKKITLDEYHGCLPCEKGDSIFLSGNKLLFMISTQNDFVVKKIKETYNGISPTYLNEIINGCMNYIETTNYNPTVDRNKILASLFNSLAWKNEYYSYAGHDLYQKTGSKVPVKDCKAFLQRWLSNHLYRQLNLWGMSDEDIKNSLEDFCTSGSIEDYMVALMEYPSRFLWISDSLNETKIEHFRSLFGAEQISPSIIRLKRSLRRSDSSYMVFTDQLKTSLGKEINRLCKHGLIVFDDNTKIAMISTYKLETSVFTIIKRKVKDCDYNWTDHVDTITLRSPRTGQSSRSSGTVLTEEQEKAVKMVLLNDISIITGGPGTGKTKVIHSIIKESQVRGISYHVAAFTGKASGRVKETAYPETIEATTIDMMIVKGPGVYKFKLLILEEASMITTKHMYRLFQKFNPLGYKIVLVGDIDQIPPIEKGRFFCSLLWSKRVPYIRLTKNFRVDSVFGGDIVRNAQRIVDPFRSLHEPIDLDIESKSFNILHGNISLLKSILIDLYKSGEDIKNLTVLTPYNEEVDLINKIFQDIRYKTISEDSLYDPTTRLRWFKDDKVMCIKNNSQSDYVNGDTGIVVDITSEDSIAVRLDKFTHENSLQFFTRGDPTKVNLLRGNLKHSYCLTINKSQGSEYDTVILYLGKKECDASFLNMNLIYTAITRAKKMVWIICEDPVTLFKACNNKLRIPDDILRYNLMSHFKHEYQFEVPDDDCMEDDFDYEY